jgi:tetratricopeptide (TPR) repeat protein
MQTLVTNLPAWAPLAAAVFGLTGAIVAIVYARRTMAMACDRYERAQDFETRLLNVLGQHPEILSPQAVADNATVFTENDSQLIARQLALQPAVQGGDAALLATAGAGWKQRVFDYMSEGRFAEAEAVCRQLIENEPRNAQAHNSLGVILRKTDRVEAAVASCRHATLLEPGSVSAHINLGVALRNLGRPRQAEAAYRRAIELDPEHAVAHSSLGVALSKQGRNEEAEGCYLRALEIDTRYTPAWLNLAIALQKRGALEEAQAAYRCALELGTASQQASREISDEIAVA